MILQLLEEHGITPKRVSSINGGEYHSPCPRCGGTDRFHTWPQQHEGQGSYWCRQCDLGGDCISFLMEYSGLTFKEAAKRTGKQLEQQHHNTRSLPNIKTTATSAPTPRECRTPAQAWQHQAQELVKKAHAALLNNPQQLQYLKDRGLDLDAVKHNTLGWIETGTKTCTFSSRQKWGLEPKPQNKKPDALWIPRGIVIPNIIDGQVDSIRIRRPNQDRTGQLADLGYYVIPGGGTAPTLHDNNAQVVTIVEAQLDAALINHHAGKLTSVIALGNDSAKPDQRCTRILQQAKLILVSLDFDTQDKNGNRPGANAWQWWQKNYDQAQRWPVPAGKDPGEAYQQGINIKQWIAAGIPQQWHLTPPPEPEPLKETDPLPEPAIVPTKSGYFLGIVNTQEEKQPFAIQSGYNTVTREEVKTLAQMDEAQRNHWLNQNGLKLFGLDVAEEADIINTAANMFDGVIYKNGPDTQTTEQSK